jgi:hypothetical protein
VSLVDTYLSGQEPFPENYEDSPLFRPGERDLPHLAVAVRHLHRPTNPLGFVVLFQIADDLQGHYAGRHIVCGSRNDRVIREHGNATRQPCRLDMRLRLKSRY